MEHVKKNVVSREVSVEVHKNSLMLETFIFIILKIDSLTDTLLSYTGARKSISKKHNSSL